MDQPLQRYVARGPLTIAGRDWRGGDSFEASEGEITEHLASGAAEPWPSVQVSEPPAQKSKKVEPRRQADA